jgi:dienelactone hydrolase
VSERGDSVTPLIAVACAAWLLLWGTCCFAQTLDPTFRTFRPEGPGKHPAVLLLSGCDGFAPSFAPKLYLERAEHLRSLGHVVVFVDYLGRRALKTCAGPVTHDDAARDLTSAAMWLSAQPWVDASRITAMGWSYGARAVLEALAMRTDRPPTFSRAIVFYPDCRALEPWTARLPVLMLLGGDDDMTPATLCQEAVRRLTVPDSVKVVVYPGAFHAFDVPQLPAKMRYGFGTIGYRPEAAAAAQKEVDRFLRDATVTEPPLPRPASSRTRPGRDPTPPPAPHPR